MPNKNDHLVVAYFPDKVEAESAADELKSWDRANDAIKLGAIAILTLNWDTGKIQFHEVGQRETKSGALWGTVIGAAVGVLSAGVGLIPGILVGAGGGAALGALKTKSVELTDDDRLRIAENLRDGSVGLAVMADDFEVEATMAELVRAGGRTEFYKLAEELAAALIAAADIQDSAAEAVDEAIEEAVEDAVIIVDEVNREITILVPEVTEDGLEAIRSLVISIDITPDEAYSLYRAGLEEASDFYKRAATPEGRAELVEETGLDRDTILAMEKKLDLMRVKGVGPKYATLLLTAGVDTCPELALRNPANLFAKLNEVNEAEEVVAALPSEEEVPDWVEQAKELPRVLVY